MKLIIKILVGLIGLAGLAVIVALPEPVSATSPLPTPFRRMMRLVERENPAEAESVTSDDIVKRVLDTVETP